MQFSEACNVLFALEANFPKNVFECFTGIVSFIISSSDETLLFHILQEEKRSLKITASLFNEIASRLEVGKWDVSEKSDSQLVGKRSYCSEAMSKFSPVISKNYIKK